MDLKKKVFTKLKAEAQAYGYKRDELMSVAAHIADNLKLAENASEEDVEDAVDEAVSASIPFLKFGQSMATRIINDAKQKDDKNDNDDDDAEPEGSDGKAPKKSNKPSGKTDDDMPAWAKKMMESFTTLTGQVESIKGEKIATSRKERVAALLKDTGTFGDLALSNFDLMTFKDDEAFEEYFSALEDGAAKFKQELADNGLQHLGNPPAPKLDKPKGEDKVFTDEELEQIAGGY